MPADKRFAGIQVQSCYLSLGVCARVHVTVRIRVFVKSQGVT